MEILTAGQTWRAHMPNVPNFLQIGPMFADISQFFYFSACRPSAIFNFHIPEILMVDQQLWRAQMHHHVKFYQNQSNGCGYMAIFRFFLARDVT